MKINFYTGDLPASFKASNIIALDSETMGLNPKRDKLCLVQISNGDENCHLVKIDLSSEKPLNLIKILKNNKIQKIFHYARFDIAVFKHNFKINIKNIYCTKIASKLVRTYTDKHGYKDLCGELLGKSISNVARASKLILVFLAIGAVVASVIVNVQSKFNTDACAGVPDESNEANLWRALP